jgi:hypothetical protein
MNSTIIGFRAGPNQGPVLNGFSNRLKGQNKPGDSVFWHPFCHERWIEDREPSLIVESGASFRPDFI